MDEVMKAGQGMRDMVGYMDLDTGLREGIQRGSGLWRAALIIMCVAVVLFVVLRVAVNRVADQRTRRIIQEGMQDDQEPSAEVGTTPDDESPTR